MFSILKQVKLIRYLVVWKINSSLVRLPDYLPTELSKVLGSIIAQRLPTKPAKYWQKAMSSWKTAQRGADRASYTPWPIESVLLVYPGKLTYNKDELIFWELKIFGDWANHGFFLEVILPAMEEASYTPNPEWNRRNGLWGHFDIHAVYVARGHEWLPLVKEGNLSLRKRVTAFQWQECLDFDLPPGHRCSKLTWVTPFSLKGITLSPSALYLSQELKGQAYHGALNLRGFLETLVYRLSQLIPGKGINNPDDIYNMLSSEEKSAFEQTMDEASRIKLRLNNLEPDSSCPGCWLGTQTFESIPPSILPYLELASIFHLGQMTHLGCGTFTLG